MALLSQAFSADILLASCARMQLKPKADGLLPLWRERLICFICGAAFFALGQSVKPLVFALWEPTGPSMTVNARTLALTNPVETHVTRAGTFEYIRMPLGEPDDLLPDVRAPLGSPRWFFPGYSKTKLGDFLRSVELSDEHRKVLLDPHRWETTQEGIYVNPPLEAVANMGRPARSQIYPVLAGSPVNSPQHYPFRFPINAVEERLGDAGLSAATAALVRRLLYEDEGTICFADGAVAQQLLPTPEFKALVNVLYREPTFLMRLKIARDADIDRLLLYWSRFGRGRELKPLFQSLSRVPGGGSINVEHLLPPFARLRLYTHGPVSTDSAKSRQNCFWTALNFFNEQPDAQYLKTENVLRALKTDYHGVNGELEFGDLVCLMDAKGLPAHICVYIADNVVFTKDGMDDREPWILMRIPDMLVEYTAKPPHKMITLRHNADQGL